MSGVGTTDVLKSDHRHRGSSPEETDSYSEAKIKNACSGRAVHSELRLGLCAKGEHESCESPRRRNPAQANDGGKARLEASEVMPDYALEGMSIDMTLGDVVLRGGWRLEVEMPWLGDLGRPRGRTQVG
ncbi:MAG: hypothetical protein M1840_004114 [Geoglossum simile]|nr:MAG: hypothetical protein M1840_004114 [Geoglossum simile]